MPEKNNTKPSVENPKSFIQSVVKAFGVLKAFDTSGPELTITDIAARTNLDRGTVFRLVNTLSSLGYINSVNGTRRFRLTLKCLEIGYSTLANSDLKSVARPLLAEVVPDYADAASLGMLDGTDVIYIERVQRDLLQIGGDRRVGSRTGAYGAAIGHAILAGLPLSQQKSILKNSNRVRTSEKTLVGIDEILERLISVKQRGYAISDGENAYGLRTVAAAVNDPNGNPVAGISLTIHQDRMPLDTFVQASAPVVCRIAEELTRALKMSFGTLSTKY